MDNNEPGSTNGCDVATKPRLSAEAKKHLQVLEDKLIALEAGAPRAKVVTDSQRAFEMAFTAADSVSRASRRVVAHTVDVDTVIGSHVKSLREEAGWTQAQLAADMDRLGFSWKRITVAEVERASRRATVEELLAVAALFAIPMASLLIPMKGQHLRFPNNRSFDTQQVEELMLGDGGELGTCGEEWPAARRVSELLDGQDDWRPARELWRRRRMGYGKSASER